MNTPSQEKQQIGSSQCANSCGFYGNPTTRNLCSKCYRNALLLENQQSTEKLSATKIEPATVLEDDSATVLPSEPAMLSILPPSNELGQQVSQSQEAIDMGISEQAAVQEDPTRCHRCNKKVGLLGFKCRCSYHFCRDHRHADCHDCSFDYKMFGRQQLTKANQRVVAEKLKKF